MKKQITKTLLLALLVFTGNAFAYDDVEPIEAYEMVVNNDDVYILDVRTAEEWNWVGHPGENKLGEGAELDGHVLNVSYMIYHDGYHKGDVLIVNRKFVKHVEKLLGDEAVIITMCRSGGRSVSAAIALEKAGFTNVYNMLTGFEGDTDAAGYRTVNGWKNVSEDDWDDYSNDYSDHDSDDDSDDDSEYLSPLPYNFSGVGDYKD